MGTAPWAAKQVQNVKTNQQSDIQPKSQAIDSPRRRAMTFPNKKSVADLHTTFGEGGWPSSSSGVVEHFGIAATDDCPISGHS
jgi:hypothetical protein